LAAEYNNLVPQPHLSALIGVTLRDRSTLLASENQHHMVAHSQLIRTVPPLMLSARREVDVEPQLLPDATRPPAPTFVSWGPKTEVKVHMVLGVIAMLEKYVERLLECRASTRGKTCRLPTSCESGYRTSILEINDSQRAITSHVQLRLVVRPKDSSQWSEYSISTQKSITRFHGS
jgi:hypothetical protein